MKRTLALLVSLVLTMACGVALAEQALTVVPESSHPDTLVVGTPTRMSGDFFCDLWGNNTADLDVRAAIHGYNIIAYTSGGVYQVNETVVEDVAVEQGPNGDKRYVFTLNPALQYSDGTPITASDYAFSVLLQASKEVRAIGGTGMTYSALVGYDEYLSGRSAQFSGVNVLSPTSLALTISGSNLPNFYELMLLSVVPYPIQVIAPSVMVVDDGEGAYLDNIDQTNPQPAFTSELLDLTINDPATGYRSHPSVCSGAYTLAAYDPEASEVSLEKNPYFIGNFEGVVPTIEHVVFKQVDNADVIAQLADGSLDIFNKASSAALIDEASHIYTQSLRRYNYLRAGFAYVNFSCEQGPTRFEEVRRAIALSIDEEKLTRDYLGGYGMRVFGYYGIGQWMAYNNLEALNELNTNAMNTNAALNALEDGGWVFNADGTPFVMGIDTLRYKSVDGGLMPLSMKMIDVKDSGISATVRDMLLANLAPLGCELKVEEMSFDEMLKRYYRQEPRDQHILVLASNFRQLFDPTYAFSTLDQHQGYANTTGVRDEALMQLAIDMIRTEPDDADSYFQKWMEFQRRFHEVLPAAPLYSNIYYDITRPDVYNYPIGENWGWAEAVSYVTRIPTEAQADALTEDANWIT